MKCPKCGSPLFKQVSIKTKFWGWRKVVSIYCALCDFENIKKFKMTKKDVQIERAKQSLIPKETILTYRKDYSKKYGEII